MKTKRHSSSGAPVCVNCAGNSTEQSKSVGYEEAVDALEKEFIDFKA